jgi:hypothetical protein
MLPNKPNFEVLPSDHFSEMSSPSSLNFGSTWCSMSPKMNELRVRNQARKSPVANLTPSPQNIKFSNS